MVLFIRQSDELPVARLELGQNHRGFEFSENRLMVDDSDTELLASLRANNYEEVLADDPRYQWIVSQGWSRQAQRDYARQPVPTEEPTEEPEA